MIEVKNLTKRYGSFTAVNNVSFFVNKGEVVGFLGPNAAGKTTTMRVITCYMPATEGTVSVAGYDVFEQPMNVKRRVGYMPEHPPLYMDMTAESYLTFVGKIKGLDGKTLGKRLDEVMERTSTTHVRKTLIAKLSRGYRQRVGLAQSLIHDPEVLVLDEPTIGLDPKQIIEVRELIKQLGEDHTIILSTHILPEVSATCGRVVIINNGRIVAEDTPENLTSGLQGAEKLRLEVEGPEDKVREALRAVEGVTGISTEGNGEGTVYLVEGERGSAVRKGVAAAVVNGGWGLLEMKSVSLSLEEVFLQLTTEEGGE